MNDINNSFNKLLNNIEYIDEDIYCIENYESLLHNLRFEINDLLKNNENISKLKHKLVDWIKLIKYINCNWIKFNHLYSDNTILDIKNNGIWNNITYNDKFKKVFFQINFVKETYQKNKIIKMDFNLLDKHHDIFFKYYNNDNLSSIISSFDDIKYTNKKIILHNKKHYNDYLFAIISLEENAYNTCENNVDWILSTTGWKQYFGEIMNKLNTHGHKNGTKGEKWKRKFHD